MHICHGNAAMIHGRVPEQVQTGFFFFTNGKLFTNYLLLLFTCCAASLSQSSETPVMKRNNTSVCTSDSIQITLKHTHTRTHTHTNTPTRTHRSSRGSDQSEPKQCFFWLQRWRGTSVVPETGRQPDMLLFVPTQLSLLSACD